MLTASFTSAATTMATVIAADGTPAVAITGVLSAL
ncbi:hypothetical protein PC129_g22279 [Phytophthora cactorum]|uniref:Uncharacterized protein n=1 Tax=Phytophthora cactorum TaxID=29920 RepID=A0A8T1H3D4_9STRA|nr:hypothetical protein PC112_g22625 [Phytophthora cactorum]KAG2822446.1 hypothetical protein PC113_g22329 [Phytophthora cactorum]KAG2823127.1 hypothetical protein PC111_g10344 [Phytophthora cactorum]KAG2910452.1 hypothetical protein PC115_g12870 [Phytophthora cactorum]KAG2960281.1 hypothetical protein PC118_g22605 [Phytophthora cactorum]